MEGATEKKPFLRNSTPKKTIYQDRLGTNILREKVEKKRVCSAGARDFGDMPDDGFAQVRAEWVRIYYACIVS